MYATVNIKIYVIIIIIQKGEVLSDPYNGKKFLSSELQNITIITIVIYLFSQSRSAVSLQFPLVDVGIFFLCFSINSNFWHKKKHFKLASA